jgi:ankyrin repeat protein
MSVEMGRRLAALSIVCRQAGLDYYPDLVARAESVPYCHLVSALEVLNDANFGSLAKCSQELTAAGSRYRRKYAIIYQRLQTAHLWKGRVYGIPCMVSPTLSSARAIVAGMHRLGEGGKTGLMTDAANGRNDAVSDWIAMGVDLDQLSADGSTALAYAALLNRLSTVRLLLQAKAGVNVAGPHGGAPIALAAAWTHYDVVEALLSARANVNCRAYGERYTALMLSVINGQQLSAEQFIAAAADVNLKAANGKTALIMAAERNDSGCVQLFLDSGAELNAQDADGRTALMHAVFQRNQGPVELLLNANADVNVRDADGKAALDLIRTSTPIAQKLIEAGAQPGRGESCVVQ